MGSSRFPGKVMADIGGVPVIWHVLRRCLDIEGSDVVILAVPDERRSTMIAQVAQLLGISVFRGPEYDVLLRYLGAARAFELEVIMRITGDCPCLNPKICSEVLALAKRPGIHYASNVYPKRTYERGLDCEAFKRETWEMAAQRAFNRYDREHVTPWMQHTDSVIKACIESGDPARANVNLCVDLQSDLENLRGYVEDNETPKRVSE